MNATLRKLFEYVNDKRDKSNEKKLNKQVGMQSIFETLQDNQSLPRPNWPDERYILCVGKCVLEVSKVTYYYYNHTMKLYPDFLKLLFRDWLIRFIHWNRGHLQALFYIDDDKKQLPKFKDKYPKSHTADWYTRTTRSTLSNRAVTRVTIFTYSCSARQISFEINVMKHCF